MSNLSAAAPDLLCGDVPGQLPDGQGGHRTAGGSAGDDRAGQCCLLVQEKTLPADCFKPRDILIHVNNTEKEVEEQPANSKKTYLAIKPGMFFQRTSMSERGPHHLLS